jgi:hypothetical protein
MIKRSSRTAILTALLVFTAAVAVQAADFSETVKVEARELVVVDLVGHVEVVQGGGNQYEVEVNVKGRDASRDDIDVVVEEKGSTTYVRVMFPTEDERRFVYPALGRGKTTINFRENDSADDSGWRKFRNALGGRKITIAGKGKGYEAWADVVVKVPRDGDATVKLGAGDIEADDIQADLVLDTHSGPIKASRIEGVLVCDTGSGHVDVRDCEGEINVDTGSGHVTGSDLKGGKVLIDTGSGRVEIEKVECRKLDIDTGSGRVEARRVTCDAARVDTGSGGVLLQLDSMGDGKFLCDTGSGGVELILPGDASCRVSCDTGSGGIKVDVPGVNVKRPDRDVATFTVGGGSARVILDTGSGSISVKMAS